MMEVCSSIRCLRPLRVDVSPAADVDAALAPRVAGVATDAQPLRALELAINAEGEAQVVGACVAVADEKAPNLPVRRPFPQG